MRRWIVRFILAPLVAVQMVGHPVWAITPVSFRSQENFCEISGIVPLDSDCGVAAPVPERHLGNSNSTPGYRKVTRVYPDSSNPNRLLTETQYLIEEGPDSKKTLESLIQAIREEAIREPSFRKLADELIANQEELVQQIPDPHRLPLMDNFGNFIFLEEQPKKANLQDYLLGETNFLGVQAPRYRFVFTALRATLQGTFGYLIHHEILGFSTPVSLAIGGTVAFLSGSYMFFNRQVYDYLGSRGLIDWSKIDARKSDFKNPVSVFTNSIGALTQVSLRGILKLAGRRDTAKYLRFQEQTRGREDLQQTRDQLQNLARAEWGTSANFILKTLEAWHSSVRLRNTTELMRNFSPRLPLTFIHDWTQKTKNQHSSYPEFLAKYILLEDVGFLAPVRAMSHTAEWMANEPLTFELADFVAEATRGAALSSLSQGSWDRLITTWRNQQLEKLVHRSMPTEQKVLESKKIYMYADMFSGINSVATMSLAVPIGMTGSALATWILIAAGSPALAQTAKLHFGSYKELLRVGRTQVRAYQEAWKASMNSFAMSADPDFLARARMAGEVGQIRERQVTQGPESQMDLFLDYRSSDHQEELRRTQRRTPPSTLPSDEASRPVGLSKCQAALAQ